MQEIFASSPTPADGRLARTCGPLIVEHPKAVISVQAHGIVYPMSWSDVVKLRRQHVGRFSPDA
jgi:hypothetical protein